MWDNLRDAKNQLSGTVVRLRNAAVKIETVRENHGELFVDYTTLYTGKDGRCRLTLLNLRPIPLGYVNTPEGALYLARRANRRWKHGLDGGNLCVIREHEASDYYLDDKIQLPLAKAVLGKYPTYDQAYWALDEGIAESVAFSRSFALSRGGVLLHKGSVVGERTGKEYELFAESIYLTEFLEESKHG